ncbi:MAG: Thioredoxin reductase TrxB [Candidatus Methanohalarchaeum thermophilum]|uniref:Thioredoxin reductase TrxB n=1 Tax=Methanohalarchaeum thermophilum TaxID=1903181 RepID=A0A1Q6DSM6_METT1|nr:MAG: Thioredoxin reductase TrxB [Candidatus Methanohalarchaeum thermophilum]
MAEEYDVLVIGGGPAGLSASIYTSRAELDTLVLDKGDNILEEYDDIENYLGFPEGISGKKLLDNAKRQAKRSGATYLQKEALSIGVEGERYQIETTDQEYVGKGVILATGVQQDKPNVENLEELEGKGVSYCVVCDGPLYKDKKCGILGSKNYAAQEALTLHEYTPNVTIYTNNKQLDITNELEQKINEKDINVDTREIKKVQGKDTIQSLLLKEDEEKTTEIEIDGLFVAVGTSGTLDFARTLGLEIENNAIKVNEDLSTGYPRLYAAGDCTRGNRQISIAVGEGTKAALNLIEELKQKEEHTDWGH